MGPPLELPEIGSIVCWGKVRYAVVGHYCGGTGKRCLHNEHALAVHQIDKHGRRLWSSTQCVDAAKVREET